MDEKTKHHRGGFKMKASILIEGEEDEVRWFSDRVSELTDEYENIKLTYMEEEK